MDEFGFGFILGAMFVVVIAIITSIGRPSSDVLANRALSCMANGSTIAQCQTVLGLNDK